MRNTSATFDISMSRNDIKCKYIMFLQQSHHLNVEIILGMDSDNASSLIGLTNTQNDPRK